MTNQIFRSRLVDEDEENLKENFSLNDLIIDLSLDKRKEIQRMFVDKQSEIDRLIREINMIKSENKTLNQKDNRNKDEITSKYDDIVKKLMNDANELNQIHTNIKSTN